MAYELHIERAGDSPIALNEWLEAVATTEGVRLVAEAAHTITNSTTGEVISFPAREGDSEVVFPDGEWVGVFRWSGRSAGFNARATPTETSHPVWKAAAALARRLGAMIRGDGGEVYNLETGESTDAEPAAAAE